MFQISNLIQFNGSISSGYSIDSLLPFRFGGWWGDACHTFHTTACTHTHAHVYDIIGKEMEAAIWRIMFTTHDEADVCEHASTCNVQWWGASSFSDPYPKEMWSPKHHQTCSPHNLEPIEIITIGLHFFWTFLDYSWSPRHPHPIPPRAEETQITKI